MQRQTFYCEGALTKDSELRYTQGGTPVLSFRIGTAHEWGFGEKKRSDRAFIGCTMFGKLAEGLKTRLIKGCIVNLEGHLKTEEWEDKQSGKMTSQLKLIVHFLSVVEIRPRQANREDDEGEHEHEEEQHGAEEDEIPF